MLYEVITGKLPTDRPEAITWDVQSVPVHIGRPVKPEGSPVARQEPRTSLPGSSPTVRPCSLSVHNANNNPLATAPHQG